MALTRGADHTREDLLGPCAAGRPIPATDLAGEGVPLAALGLLERCFLRLEFLREGGLPGHELLQFVLWLHPDRR